MTSILVRKLLKDIRGALIAVAVILFIFSAFWVKICQRITTEIAPFFNALGQVQGVDKKVFDELIFKGPGKISQAVMGGAEIQFDKPNDFLAVELLHPVIIILGCLWAVGRAGGAIAGELERGTMELLLSQPVPRNRLILAHFLVDCLVIPFLCLSIIAGTQFGLWVVGPFNIDYSGMAKLPPAFQAFLKTGPAALEVSATRQSWAILNLVALLFATSGLTIMVSAWGRSRLQALGLSTLMGVVMFMANVIGQLWDGAAFVRPFTVFFYYQPQKIWLKDAWSVDFGEAFSGGDPLFAVPVLPVLFAIGFTGYAVAWRIFERRDLPAPL
jgi:ABC-2 type transport system permease protein